MRMFVFEVCHKISQPSLAAVTRTNGPLSGLVISFITNLRRCQHKTVQSTGIWVVSLVKLAQGRNTTPGHARALWAGSLWAAPQVLLQDPASLNVTAPVDAWPEGSSFFIKMHIHLSSKGGQNISGRKPNGALLRFFCHPDLRNEQGQSRHWCCRTTALHTWVSVRDVELFGFFWRWGKPSRPPRPPRGFLQDARSPFAALAFSSIPTAPQGKAGKPKWLHHFVIWTGIPTSGLGLQSQGMVAINRTWFSCFLVTKQTFPGSRYWENALAWCLPSPPGTGRCSEGSLLGGHRRFYHFPSMYIPLLRPLVVIL